MTKYVIVGGSAGAVGAVEAIREVDPTGDIAVISDEPTPAYSRPMIADYLSGEADLEKMFFPDQNFWDKNKVQMHLGKKATKLDFSRKTVSLEDDERLGFDKLLIATGGKPFIPKMEGSNLNGVYNFITVRDAQNIKEAVGKAKSAVVIGGGLIGVSATEALLKRGLKVTIVELKDWLLNLILDKEAAKIVEDIMREKGVTIIAGHTIQRIFGRNDDSNAVGGVVLNDKTQIECDMVVVAVGVVPRTELATQTDLKVNRGILVDRFMRTSVPDVYACGDVAEAYDFLIQTQRVLALWPLARIGGRIAGYNMAGKKCEYPGGTAMSALHYFGVSIISVGLTVGDESGGFETLISRHPELGTYKKILLKNGVIMGMTLVQDVEGAGIIFNLIKNHVNVEAFKHKLTADNFSLAVLPEKLRKQILLGV